MNPDLPRRLSYNVVEIRKLIARSRRLVDDSKRLVEHARNSRRELDIQIRKNLAK